jgi:hypothetical protein
MAIKLGEFSPIGQFFALRHFVGNYKSSRNVWATFYHSKSYIFIFTKMAGRHILGGFKQIHLVALFKESCVLHMLVS